MWATILTIFKRRQTLRTAGLLALCVALITTLLFDVSTMATPGINRTISFQGRLQYSTGGAVADGFYNMQFKIYQDGTRTSGGTLEWTENYVNNNNDEGVEVKNGYFSVELGTNNPFASQVDWNQDTLWLTMNVAGSADNCTTFNSGACVADGEMNPRQRFTSTPYSLNSGALEGKTASNFVQLSQGVQNDTANNSSSIFINKTGTGGNLLQLQNAGVDALTVTNTGNLLFGASVTPRTISVAESGANTDGSVLVVAAGQGGSGIGSNGGDLGLLGGDGGGTNGNGGNVIIDGGYRTGSGDIGSVFIGISSSKTVVIGGMATESITIGGGESANQNVVIGTGSNATSGTTTVQSKDDTVIETNGTQRARFSGTGNTLYVGNANASGNATTANSFTIQGTSSTGSNTQGGSLNLQAGSATSGNANGGNLTLSGGSGVGTGAKGLVVIDTPTFSTTSNDANCFTSGALVASTCTVTAASINNTSAIIIGFSATGQTANIPDPTNTTAGRVVYITAANGSSDFTLSLNGGGTGNLTSMRQNTSATLIWNGSDWTVAGASNSTTLQSAYNNTLQSAGGAELIVSSGSNANGLTIRDSSTNPVNGTLLEVQNASASTLFSVNSNVPEYATNGGTETAGASSSTFPASTWSVYGSNATISRHTTPGDYIATGQASAKIITTGFLSGIKNQLSTTLTPNMKYNVSFGARLESGTFSDMTIAYASDGSSASATCSWSNVTIVKSAWKKVSCSFTTPASGLSSANALIIGQIGNESRTFYIDNLSVTIAGNQNYATDGTVNNSGSFATNWTSAGQGTVNVTRNTSDGQESSDSAQAQITSGAANAGLRNKLSINPLPSTLYRLTTYAKVSSGSFTDFKLRYSRDGGTNFTDCVDYNTQTLSTTEWTEVTCYVTTDSTAATNPYAYFVETSSSNRTFMVDSFEMTLATNTSANVQIGGGGNGGQTTLFTLDQGASAPISDNNDALLGSMYYDTTLGKIQCYEADGWGACGSSPDNVVTISPEYNNAVMSGTGVGTMTSDFCSDTLNINDGSSGQPSICAAGQTHNLYKWTSPQTTNQTYSIYVTYQLPSTFKSFTSGSTSLKGRTDNGSNGGTGTVQYTVYRNNGTSLDACGSAVAVSTGTQTTWQTGQATGTADPSTCGFQPGESIVFKIDMTANRNAIAYVSNLGFTFSNN